MIEQDTIRLLRECDAGITMGVNSIDEVMDSVSSAHFRQSLTQCKAGHLKLKEEIRELLSDYQDEGKDPNPLASGMSHIKTSVRLMMKESDQTIADLITDGCNMGVKTLSRYLNQYKAASEKAKDLTKKLIRQEEQLAVEIRPFL